MNDITETLIRDTIAHPTNVTIERDGGYTMYHSFIDSGESYCPFLTKYHHLLM